MKLVMAQDLELEKDFLTLTKRHAEYLRKQVFSSRDFLGIMQSRTVKYWI